MWNSTTAKHRPLRTAPISQLTETMRLAIATAVAALATTVAGDAMMVYKNCELPTICHLYGAWYSAYGSFLVDAADGCRGQGSGMVDFCMDCKQHHAYLPLIHTSVVSQGLDD